MDYLSLIEDPRVDRMKKHHLIDILVITLCGVLSGFDEMIDIADYAFEKQKLFSSFLELPNGIPSHDTLSRVISLIEPEGFEEAIMGWIASLKKDFPDLREIISVDGKSVRRSYRRPGDLKSCIGIVSAWSVESGLCLGQSKYETKKGKGEKQAMESLLERLYLKGCIVTLDAGGATPAIAQKIIKKNSDYMIGLKGNQGTIQAYAKELFESPPVKVFSYRTEEKGHGREEIRQYSMLNLHEVDFDQMPDDFVEIWIQKWPELTSIIEVQSTREVNKKKSQETRWYLSSLKDDVAEAARAIRSHWGVENSLHYVLDVTFREDHARQRIKYATENMSAIRRMALSMLKQQDPKLSFKRKRHRCNWSNEYLERTLWTQIEN